MTEKTFAEKVAKEIEEIETAFSRGGNYINETGRPRYKAHAVILEDTLGMKGIAGRYKLPDGKDHDWAEHDYRKDFLKYAVAAQYLSTEGLAPEKRAAAETFVADMPKALKQINAELAKIEKLNPEISKLEFNKESFIEPYRALIGITSQYNVDDINAYLKSVREDSRDEKAQAKKEELKKKGVKFGWTPAYTTLIKIEKELVNREKIKSASIDSRKR